MRPVETRPTASIRSLVVAGIVLLLGYALAGTWSVGQGFGGYDADGGWIDFDGRPTSSAPVTVDVVGHPALWVQVVVVAILVAAGVWAARTGGAGAGFRRRAGIGVATLVVVAVVLVFTVLQIHLVQDAFARGDTRPPILGNVTVTTSTMPPG